MTLPIWIRHNWSVSCSKNQIKRARTAFIQIARLFLVRPCLFEVVLPIFAIPFWKGLKNEDLWHGFVKLQEKDLKRVTMFRMRTIKRSGNSTLISKQKNSLFLRRISGLHWKYLPKRLKRSIWEVFQPFWKRQKKKARLQPNIFNIVTPWQGTKTEYK